MSSTYETREGSEGDDTELQRRRDTNGAVENRKMRVRFAEVPGQEGKNNLLAYIRRRVTPEADPLGNRKVRNLEVPTVSNRPPSPYPPSHDCGSARARTSLALVLDV